MPRHRTGQDLRRIRKAAGMRQTDLARLAGVSRDAVQYWEKQPRLNLRGYAVGKMLRALVDQYARARDGLQSDAGQSPQYARAGARYGVKQGKGLSGVTTGAEAAFMGAMRARGGVTTRPNHARPEPDNGARMTGESQGMNADNYARARGGVIPDAGSTVIPPRPGRCGAKTRQGHPCRMKPVQGKRRCRLHGGKSTGPKTKAGRARIAEAQRKRWAKARALSKADSPE